LVCRRFIFGDTIIVRGGSEIYEFLLPQNTTPTITSLFGVDFGQTFFFNPYAITKIPKPDDFPAPFFSGEYFIPGLRYIPTAWSNQEISGEYNNIVYPNDTITRTILFAQDDDATGGNQSYEWAIYEYTGVTFTSESEFQGWDDEDLPPEISSKGFVKSDLVRPPGTSGQIYAKVYDIPPGPDDANLNSFHFAFALIPWNEEPGNAYPSSNFLYFAQGSLSPFRIYNDFIYFSEEEPSLVFDGREYFNPGPTESQPYLRNNIYEWYLSSNEGDIYFYIKQKNNANRAGTDTNSDFEEHAYLKIDKDGNIKNQGIKPETDFVAGDSFTDLRALLAIQEGYKDWKWPLTGLDSVFSERDISDSDLSNSTDLSLEFPFSDSIKNTVSLNSLLKNNRHVDDAFVVAFNMGELNSFLSSGDDEAEITSSITPYSLSYDAVNFSNFSFVDSILISYSDVVESTVLLKRPSRLMSLKDEHGSNLKINFFIPIISSSQKASIENLIV
jgi:hypothetical protein